MVVLNKSPQQTYKNAANATSKYRSNEGQVLIHDKNEPWNGTTRLVVCLHGHAGDAQTFNINTGPGAGTYALSRTGRYAILSIDAGGPAEWGNPNAQQSILDAVTWARALGVKPGKYSLVGWSMGGAAALIHIGDHAADVAGAWLWVPACDLRYFANTYANPYDAPQVTTWASEFPTAYPSGVDASDPMQHIAKFQGINVPTYFALASDDNSIPPAQADYFLAAVNNPSFFQSPKGKVTGGHTQLFGQFTDAEFVAHFDSLEW